MKAFAILLCIYMVLSLVSSLPIISKPLENNPDQLVWEALLTIDTHRSDDKTRKIPKSIFITPNLNESKGNCPPDHKLGPDGRCYKTLKIDPLVILKTQIESLLKKNRTATTEYDEDYDYSEYGESTESMNSNGQYTVPLSLGFGNDQRPIHLQQQQQQHQQRIQQQQQQQSSQSQSYTTFPSLNRVVKDDSHIATNLHVSSEKENQPFLVSTTGLDLGSEDDDAEDDVIKSKFETSSSGATASSLVPSSTKVASNTVDIEPSSTSSFIESETSAAAAASTNPTSTITNADTTTVHGLPSQTTILSTNPEEIASSTDEHITPKMATDSKIKALPIEPTESNAEPLESTTTDVDEKIALTTEQDHTIDASTEPIENSTTKTSFTNGYSNENLNKRHTAEALTINGTTEGVTEIEQEEEEAVTVTTIPTDEIDSTTTSVQNDKVIHLTPSNDDQTQSSTNMPMDLIELKQQKQNESSNQLPTLSQKLIDMDKDDVQATSAIPTSGSSTNNVPFKTDANESSDDLIDAVFIPSQFDTLIDEMDPAVGKTFNNSAADESSKLHLENGSTSAIVDAELPEAEIAPIIDTGKSPRANIELIDNLDESTHIRSGSNENDDAKNLNARLADELLFMDATKDNQATSSTPSPISSPPPSLSIVPLSTIAKSTSTDKGLLLEETLNGAPVLGIGLNSDVTTEESIDYDSNEAKMDRKNADNLGNSNIDSNRDGDSDGAPRKNADYVSVSSEKDVIQPFMAQTQTIEIPPTPEQLQQQQQQQQKKPSIYSTFMNRLKYAPPIVDLSVDNNRPESTIQYSHNPFNLASVIEDVNERSTPTLAPSQPTLTSDDRGADGQDDNVSNIQSTDIIDSLSGSGAGGASSGNSRRGNTNRHQLQIGINCYLRNLGNKQQFIICDNA